MRVLVTGASGFVGRRLVSQLSGRGDVAVTAAVRREVTAACLPGVAWVAAGELSASTDWRPWLRHIDAVVYCAARVHTMRDDSVDSLAQYRRINVEPTLQLARQAAAAGVRRLVFLSSVKVNGEAGTYSEETPPAPVDDYGRSKHEAEVGLRQIAADQGLEVTIIRPPLVYGPGVKANFAALMRAIERGIPLPLGAVDNRRSLIAVDNLVDFIVACIEQPAAANQTFLISDGDDCSTPELVRRLSRAMARPVRLIAVPPALLRTAAALTGRRAMAQRLLGSLQVDISKARQLLGWTPPISVGEGLRRAAGAS